MIEGYDIVCFGPGDWWSMNPSCTTHIMKRLSGQNRILYVNPFSSDILGSAASGHKRGFGVRIVRKLKSITKYLKKPGKNLYVFSPIFIPVQGKRCFDILNNVLLYLQLKSICKLVGIYKPILWLENIRAADMMDWFQQALTVYHVSDLFVADSYTSSSEFQLEREKHISKESDLLVCVSKELYSLKLKEWDCVHYLPHGVDFELFQNAAREGRGISEITGVSRPIAGYFGTMTAHNDIELLHYCAQKLPDVSFVLAGQITGGDYSGLTRLPNVHILGRIPYEKIPQLCACFDVCMLQWKMSEWIRNCNPLKMLEYMASGKPIVSVEIKEAMQYSDIVSVAHNKEQFCRLIRWELLNDTPERARSRVGVARKHSWEKHVEELSALITEALAKKRHVKEGESGLAQGIRTWAN